VRDQLDDPAQLDAAGVTEIDEEETAVVSFRGYPASKPDPPAYVVGSKVSGSRVAISVDG
jgi:hypothetical protein